MTKVTKPQLYRLQLLFCKFLRKVINSAESYVLLQEPRP